MSPVECARELIGQAFVWEGVGGVIVETEAYAAEGDEACHTFSRPSARIFIERNLPGTAYVYLNYGIHWLVNVLVKGPHGAGLVLMRGLEPRWGIDTMQQRRNCSALKELCSGPGKLGVALGMNLSHHGLPLAPAFRRIDASSRPMIEASPRIGISKATTFPWRFTLAGNPYLSR